LAMQMYQIRQRAREILTVGEGGVGSVA
jgi:hypothetical protein